MSERGDWVHDERFQVHYYPAIFTDDNGERRSIWPAKWSLQFLESIEHTRQFAKNYMSSPLGADGGFWSLEDVDKARLLGRVSGMTRTLVSVDPAVSTKRTSDYTGIAVVGWQPPGAGHPNAPGRCTVLEVRQVRKVGAELRLDLLDTIERHNAGLVLVETNQGGDLWRAVLWGMPVKVKAVHQSEPKEERAARVLDHYQRGRVGHVEGLTDFEGQLVAFPRAPHDDMVDAVGSGVAYFLDRSRKRVSVVGVTEGYAA